MPDGERVANPGLPFFLPGVVVRRSATRSAVVAATTALALVGASAAYAADNLIADGDGAVPVATNALAFGTVCRGSAASDTVALAIQRSGGSQVFANAATVALSVQTAPAGVTVGPLGSITLPGDWVSQGNGTLSSVVIATVAIDTSAVRTYNGTVALRATGSEHGGGTLTRNSSLSVTGSVVACDSTPPVLTVPGPLTVEATGPAGAPATWTVSAHDAVDGPRPVTCSAASGATYPLGVTTVGCSASDLNGNTATASFTVTVADTTAPALSLPAARTVEATSPSGAAATWTATAADLVDGARTVACTPASGATFALGTTSVACSASDSRGNTATGSFAVTVVDTTAPAIDAPTAVDVEATGPDGAVATWTATATDAADPAVPVSCAPASGGTFAVGSTTVTCTATDDAGNTAQRTFAVNVGDTTAPHVNVPGPVTVEATGPAGAAATYAVTAHDVVDGDLAAACAPASGATFALGTTTVECTATDAHGNTGSGSFPVTVEDTTEPALALPANLVAEATGPGGAFVTWTATADDLVDGAVSVTCSRDPGTFALGTATVTCTAADTRGNTAEGSFTVTVADTTAPALTLPGTTTAEATSPAGAPVTWTATASDAVDGTVAVTCDPASGATLPLGTTTVSCGATDAAGNTAGGTFDVVVRDTTAPALSVPAGIVAEATSAAGAAVTYAASASDAADPSVPVSCVPASGATFALGATTVECTATDDAGNTASESFGVVVQDTTAPAVTVPAGATVEATGPGGAAYTYAASASDAVSGALAPSCAPASGATFALGATTVTCTATDGAGLTGSASFTVTVVDTTAPALTLPASVEATATSADGAAVTYAASASDAVSGAVATVCSPASGAAFGVGTTTVSCAATDGAGNTATGSFPVTVRYVFSGFQQPVNDTAHQTGVLQSRFKLGSTVPLKFRLGTAGGTSVQQAGAPAFAKTYRGNTCDSQTATETVPETSVTGGTSYRWDGAQYVYTFSTKGLAAGEWRVWAVTADGARNYVDLCLTR